MHVAEKFPVRLLALIIMNFRIDSAEQGNRDCGNIGALQWRTLSEVSKTRVL
jgi:hypothetical protein